MPMIENLEKVDETLEDITGYGYTTDIPFVGLAKLRDARQVLRLTIDQLREERETAKAKQTAINLLAYLCDAWGTYPSGNQYHRLNPQEREAITNVIAMLEGRTDK